MGQVGDMPMLNKMTDDNMPVGGEVQGYNL